MAKADETRQGEAGAVEDIPARSLLRPAILVLLKEHESHGYELVTRLSELGFEVPDVGWIYRTLRTMDRDGLVTSEWGLGNRGPARRIYGLTPHGEEQLGEAAVELVHQRRVIGDLVARYRRLMREERSAGAQRTALVVEDDPDVRQTLWILLERRGWSIDDAPDGETALVRWAEGKYSLLIVDYRMPGISGLDVARELRERGAREPIVLYSAYLRADVEVQAERLGVRCIGKGDFTELFEVVSQYDAGPRPRRRGGRQP